MPDLLVRLYQLPAMPSSIEGISIRRAFTAEKATVIAWVFREFGSAWANEAEVTFARQPVACFVAIQNFGPIGFACYDSIARGFFGPTGVSESMRQRGIGRSLLSAALHDMAANGYAYAVIGGAGSMGFYQREVGAIEIPDSTPGFYRGLLRRDLKA